MKNEIERAEPSRGAPEAAMREEFEKWFRPPDIFFDFRRDSTGMYYNSKPRRAYEIWSAAWQAAESGHVVLLEALKRSQNVASEIYAALVNYVGHAADCLYHQADSPEGDVCVCRVQQRIREVKTLIERTKVEAEAAIKQAEGTKC
jgi:hypothetical protein